MILRIGRRNMSTIVVMACVNISLALRYDFIARIQLPVFTFCNGFAFLQGLSLSHGLSYRRLVAARGGFKVASKGENHYRWMGE